MGSRSLSSEETRTDRQIPSGAKRRRIGISRMTARIPRVTGITDRESSSSIRVAYLYAATNSRAKENGDLSRRNWNIPDILPNPRGRRFSPEGNMTYGRPDARSRSPPAARPSRRAGTFNCNAWPCNFYRDTSRARHVA